MIPRGPKGLGELIASVSPASPTSLGATRLRDPPARPTIPALLQPVGPLLRPAPASVPLQSIFIHLDSTSSRSSSRNIRSAVGPDYIYIDGAHFTLSLRIAPSSSSIPPRASTPSTLAPLHAPTTHLRAHSLASLTMGSVGCTWHSAS